MKRKSIMFAGMTIQNAKERLLFQLYHIYDQREAGNISDWVLEHLTGWKKIDRIINKNLELNKSQAETLERYIDELSNHRPVQYVLGEAWFQGMRFFVNESTLIPRPETEELVEWVVSDYKEVSQTQQLVVLDVGTGSGCIPISIVKKLPSCRVISCDISKEAVAVAQGNAVSLGAEAEFIVSDILNEASWDNFPQLDIIVSNPPYIPASEKSNMSANVLNHEPHEALFVPDNNALLFYEVIARLASRKLKAKGRMYFEIHESLAEPVTRLLEKEGFQEVVVRKDMQGKDRMVSSRKS
ncbi:MAG TPA: peptide chain release factor N(5)-glutamine methyltransferase [Flavitalea sp.]|nr:peptide chain release factor N(5)-glutamine methyltransferase [Flavitalea sp.]